MSDQINPQAETESTADENATAKKSGRLARIAAGATGIAAAIALAASLLSGPTIDASLLAGSIETKITAETGLVVDAECPDGEPSEVGHVFHCSVTEEDGTVHHVRVEVTSTDGDVSWEVE